MSQTFLHLDAKMSFTSSSTSACSTSPNASTFSHCPSTKAAKCWVVLECHTSERQLELFKGEENCGDAVADGDHEQLVLLSPGRLPGLSHGFKCRT